MTCKACLLDHSPLVGCMDAMRRRARMKVVAAVEKAVEVRGGDMGFEFVPTKKARERDRREAHNAYQREYQRKRRAKLKEAV